MTPAEIHAAAVAEVARLRKQASGHEWHGGYYCECGHVLNSPRGYVAHIRLLSPASEWLGLADLILYRHEPWVGGERCANVACDERGTDWPCPEVAAVLKALGVEA